MSEAGAPQRRPGGRTAKNRDAVLRAAAELIAAGEHPTIADIAARSGVHQATIYRRWGSSEAIILDLAAAQVEVESPIPDTGSLRGDLLAYANGAAASIQAPNGLALLRAVISTTPAPGALQEAPLALVRRGNEIQRMLDRARDAGEPTLSFADVLDGILAPIYMRVVLGVGGIDSSFLSHLVDHTLELRDGTGLPRG